MSVPLVKAICVLSGDQEGKPSVKDGSVASRLGVPHPIVVVSTLAGRDLAARLPGNAHVILYEDAYHDLYRDPVAERATADLVQWLGERLADAGSAAGDVTV